jgi:hypothetical protein
MATWRVFLFGQWGDATQQAQFGFGILGCLAWVPIECVEQQQGQLR